jgi:hypothetical protein
MESLLSLAELFSKAQFSGLTVLGLFGLVAYLIRAVLKINERLMDLKKTMYEAEILPNRGDKGNRY